MFQKTFFIVVTAIQASISLQASMGSSQASIIFIRNEWQMRVEQWARNPHIVDHSSKMSIEYDQSYSTPGDPKCYVVTAHGTPSDNYVSAYTIGRGLNEKGDRCIAHQVFDHKQDAQRWIQSQLDPLGYNCSCCVQ